ncbi:MAG TPA: MmgE/PrpD family protein [Phycisphaerales bacterium]
MASYRTDNFISFDLARWAASLRFEDLSPAAIEAAKRFWLDSLACAIGGSRTEDAHILLEHHREMSPSGDGPCSVLLNDWRTNPVDAAFLNSHMIRAMDYNDIYWKADPCHPSDLICGPLALCELHDRSGRDLILATAIVYELQCRFAEIGRPGIREYGWHHATLSGFAAGLAAGRVLGLTPEQLANAIGICASRTGTLGAVTAGSLTMMKNTVDPWAARMGVESALLAARGYTGPAHIIDGKEGLFHVFGHAVSRGTPCTFDAEGLTRDLPRGAADAWRIERCSMKSFPVEALMHSPLSAIRQIRAAHTFVTTDIREVRVEVIARAADILGDPAKYRPTTRETADHSLPYSIAALLADGVLGPAQFDEARVRDPRLVPLMDSVKVVPNEAFEARFPASQPSRVTITLHDGSQHAAEVEYPKGDPRNPLTWDEIETKLRSLALGVIDDDTVDRVRDRVHRLDAISTRQLCEALTSQAVTSH